MASRARTSSSRVPIWWRCQRGSTARVVTCPSSADIISPPYPTTSRPMRATKYARLERNASSLRKSDIVQGLHVPRRREVLTFHVRGRQLDQRRRAREGERGSGLVGTIQFRERVAVAERAVADEQHLLTGGDEVGD